MRLFLGEAEFVENHRRDSVAPQRRHQNGVLVLKRTFSYFMKVVSHRAHFVHPLTVRFVSGFQMGSQSKQFFHFKLLVFLSPYRSRKQQPKHSRTAPPNQLRLASWGAAASTLCAPQSVPFLVPT